MTLEMGGMALENGVLLQTERHWAAAVRADEGRVLVAGGSTVPLKVGQQLCDAVPLARGPLRIAGSLAVLAQMRAALPEARLPFESRPVVAAMAVSTAVSAFLRRPDPKRRLRSDAGRELAVAALALLPAALALRMSDLAAYHGAEHKTIGTYEREAAGLGGQAGREHERCGSELVAPLLVLDAMGNVAVRRVFRRPPRAAFVATGILSLAGAYELVRWSMRHRGSCFARWVHGSGELLQKVLTTREPSQEQMAVAEAALKLLLELEKEEVAS